MKQLKRLCSSACVPAFYSSRYGEAGVHLSLEKVSQEIDWSIALSLIKYEGIYHFGGRDEKNVASNRLIVIQIEKNCTTTKGTQAGEPSVTLVKLEPKGIPPPGRYMHTMTYFQEKSLVTISGGRNDQLSNIVLGDLWVLRLDDLEYQKVVIKSDLDV